MRKSWVGVVINLISASFLFISARDKEHKESLKQSIQELGKPIAESLFLPPKDSKKGKTQVGFSLKARIQSYMNYCVQAVWTPEQQKHGNQLLAVAVAGSCLPMSFVRDKNIKRWVSNIAPQVPQLEFCFHILNASSL